MSSSGSDIFGYSITRKTRQLSDQLFGAADFFYKGEYCTPPSDASTSYEQIHHLHDLVVFQIKRAFSLCALSIALMVGIRWQPLEHRGDRWFCSITSVAALPGKNRMHSYTVHHLAGSGTLFLRVCYHTWIKIYYYYCRRRAR